jgi:hypothetical protein
MGLKVYQGNRWSMPVRNKDGYKYVGSEISITVSAACTEVNEFFECLIYPTIGEFSG